MGNITHLTTRDRYQVGQTLREAAQVINRQGWRQGGFGTCDGPVCAAGAVSLAADRLTGHHPDGQVGCPGKHRAFSLYARGLDLFEETLRQVSGVDQVSTSVWNDRWRRTEQEVTAALVAVGWYAANDPSLDLSVND